MIREAELKDLARIVEMGAKFHAGSEYRECLAQNSKQIAATAEKLICLPNGGVLLLESDNQVIGMLAYVMHNHFISGEKVCGEIAWWTEPEKRGNGVRLVRAVETLSRESGAKLMHMIAPNDAVAGMYQRMGYKFVEATYQKAL